ncbi:carotenoid oxygenase family protein [Nostoc sp. FACHB-110]|uniref:carotenoid oxygenase family protein n=1 Tax=Nostoc sp. FACHB-110 TaxID=2692834 RepID=UPI0016863CCD|nr:carotenoid oxygenase family protein [Nostoc sp. FACHB-110]MBD2436841.1 carotenoid oxygenase family protein [Nostoc sp. FACHB-110]
MQTMNKKPAKKAWAGAISQPATEFPLTPLPILSGKIPAGLRGTLYRNGPARLKRGNTQMGHWFDGDGAILAVNFHDAGATGIYRYVQTAGYQQETTAGKLLYGNYGTTAPGLIWQKWQKLTKNTANTSVLALPDKLLALWEGGHPHSLDLETLETQGLDNLGGLKTGWFYSAHPKIDAQTKEIFNFGLSLGLNATLNIYKSDWTGRIIQKSQFQLAGIPLIHDFVLAGKYLVFFIPAVRLDILPIIMGTSSYSDSLKWQPDLGTQILVIDRENLSLVSRQETEAWFQWHFANAYVDDHGAVIVDFTRYADFQTNQYLKEVATGETHNIAKNTLTRLVLQPQTGKVKTIETLLDRTGEFPNVPPQNVGQISRYTYMCLFREGTDISQELLNTIARFDHQSQTLTEANLGENRYPCESLTVQDALNHQQSWVLTVVYDGNCHSSEVWIFDSDRLDAEPVCQLALPSVVPHSFHGMWKARA